MPEIFRNRFFVVALAAGLGALAVACGGGDDDPAPTATSRPAEPTATTPAATPTPSGPAGDATRGESLFVSETCSACHSTGENQVVGPGLKGIRARAAALGGDDFLIESMKDPTAVVTEGFAPVMSSFAHLDDQKIADIVAYLNTLD